MRPICLAAWVLPGRCALMLLASGCAEGGIDDAELSAPAADKSTSDGGSRAHDARVSTSPAADSISGRRDAGGGSSGPSSSGSGSDAGTSAASAASIKCPSPMVCTNSIATILSALDPTVKANESLCAESGGLIPMAVSCQTVDECKSARLTSSTCSGGYCLQRCTP